MRWRWLLVGFLFGGCSSDYEGDRYPQVVDWHDVQVVDEVPSDARVIGVASEYEESNVDGTSVVEYSLWCNLDDRLIRRMKRAAAREGGEFLVDVQCETYEEEETYADGSDLYCETWCEGSVARRWQHDR